MLELDKIYNMDCIEGMKQLSDNSIDLIVTDPPYFLPAQHYQTRKQFNRSFIDWSMLEYFFKDVFKEFRRIVKSTGRIYVFCDGQSYPIFFYYLYPFCKSVRPLIWDKKTSINGYSWRHQYEMIIFAELPKAKPVPSGDGDIIRCSAVKVDKRNHPAQKPREIIRKLIGKSSSIDDVVCDPFVGSGITCLMSKQLNRRYIGFELDKGYYNISCKQLINDNKQLKITT